MLWRISIYKCAFEVDHNICLIVKVTASREEYNNAAQNFWVPPFAYIYIYRKNP